MPLRPRLPRPLRPSPPIPFRPRPFQTSHAPHPPPRWLPQQRQHQHPPRPPRPRTFHTTTPCLADSTAHAPTHYETLGLAPTATPTDIKRQFFALSKQHHPDKNPADPTASTRFVQISEAYHVLSVPAKRSQYDAQLQQTQASSRWGPGPGGGSYSSASYAGSRPATGLNKKRGTFRGPPPSFYKAGGYGQHGAKRAEYAHHHPHHAPHHRHPHHHHHGHTGAEGAEAAGSHGEEGGFGSGHASAGRTVPHFNDQAHKQTHDQLNATIARRKTSHQQMMAEIDRGGTLINFIVVSGIIVAIGINIHWMRDWKEKGDSKKWKEEQR
ncbi:DnaJ-domain-containing protein [Amniculicola lignicola CBS 123094]|uniref:DnaJ-domain-containing protein n=1 Tax=Amniculicola lignicola CBS 123094 TaxID=1392246 RepID=A0A6A5WW40_9PLEO|nr:DnaJ-domain-containing protein [Amniculicola lignicola CBS 123094]